MPVQKSVGDRWQKVTGCLLVVGYGLSETAPAASIDPVNGKAFSDTIGLPLPSTEMSIQNKKGEILSVGEVGEICIFVSPKNKYLIVLTRPPKKMSE